MGTNIGTKLVDFKICIKKVLKCYTKLYICISIYSYSATKFINLVQCHERKKRKFRSKKLRKELQKSSFTQTRCALILSQSAVLIFGLKNFLTANT